jgi:hypothetical protein
MLVLPKPKMLMFGYLLGALMTSITIGLAIVFSISGEINSSPRTTISPAIDIALGALILVITYVIKSNRSHRLQLYREKRREKRSEKGPPAWQRHLSSGNARTTFIIGACLTLPGFSYLLALGKLAAQDVSTSLTVLIVIAFNLIMLMLLEIPLLGFVFNPKATERKVAQFKAWITRSGGRILTIVAVTVGIALIVRGIAELIAS